MINNTTLLIIKPSYMVFLVTIKIVVVYVIVSLNFDRRS